MAIATNSLLSHLRHWLVAQGPDPSSDALLLDRVVRLGDEAAFTALLERYGPMVMRVCRRQLRDGHDTEDAFQATFLVLARRAAAICKQNSIGAWLHGVAYKVARRLREQRRSLETGVPDQVAVETRDEPGSREELALLDEELCALPAKYRTPLILYHLQGHAQTEVAAQLGLPLRTLEYRLARGRELLRRQLARRGVQGTALLLTLELAAGNAPAALIRTTVAAGLTFAAGNMPGTVSAGVVTLAKGTLQSMTLVKWKLAPVLFLSLCIVGVAAGVVGEPVPSDDPPTPALAEVADQAKAPPVAESPRVRADLNGDPLPDGAIARLGTIRFRQGGAVKSLAFAPDGATLLSSSWHEPIRLWDVASGKELRNFGGPKDTFYRSTLSPDGKLLAVPIFRSVKKGQGWGSETESLRVWDMATGKEVGRFGGTQQGHYGVAFSPDSKILATGAADKIIRLWDLATGQEIGQLQGHETAPVHLVFSPDGKILAAQGYGDTGLRLWDVTKGKLSLRIDSKKPWGGSPAFTPDGKAVVVLGEGGAIFVWDITTGKELRRFPRGFTINSSPHFVLSQDGQTLLTVAEGNKTVRVWEFATGKELRPLEHPGKVHALVYLPDNKHAASAGDEGVVRMWDVAAAKEVHRLEGHRGWVEALAISPDGKRLASGGNDTTVRVWDTATGKELRPTDSPLFSPYTVAVSPDAKTFALEDSDGQIALWDIATGKVLRRLAGHKPKAGFVRFSPDGSTLISTGGDRTLRFWDLATGAERAHVTGVVFIGSFTPDGKEVAASGDGGLRLLDVATGRELRTLPTGGQPSFSPDAKVVALSLYEREAPQKYTLRLYRVGSGKEIGRLDDHAGAHGDFAISPDGKALAMAAYDKEGGSYTVRVLELATLKERCRFHRPSNEPIPRLYVAFSPNGRIIASGADDEIVLWDVASGKEVTRLAGHRGRVSGLRFSADGSRLISWGYDNAVLVWDVAGLSARCRLPAANLSPRDLETRWAELGGADVPRAHQAVWQLVAAPEKSVEFLRGVLRPVAQPDPQRIKSLIADLEDNQTAVRRKADDELAKLGEQAETALLEVLAGKPSLDVRRRVESLLDKLDRPDTANADSLRSLRGIEVLERAGTSEARRLLEELSRGGGARQTREAKGALERLARHAVP